MTITQKNAIETVYQKLKNREINPKGFFDNGGRFYAENAHLIDVRAPSRNYPYSQMVACRTKKYVTAVSNYYGCKTVKTLLRYV